MGGAAFPTKTATSPAPTTVWFGSIPDRLTLTWGGRVQSTGNGTGSPGQPGFYANQWNLINSSFGTFTTAPDGTTNTMQLIVEDNTTNDHGIVSTFANGFRDNFNSTTPRFRLAGFFKAATRTRVALYAQTGSFGATDYVYTVFDLAGGRIGAGPTNHHVSGNSPLTVYGAEIVPFGNGVYRCSMDFNFTFNGGGALAPLALIDAGSGTGAANFLSYAGNGTSGIYAWKMSLMPLGAYGLNNVAMFDDFNNLSTIDVHNTGAPGFNWYVTVSWPGFTGPVPPDVNGPSNYSIVSPSVLSLTIDSGKGGYEYTMATAQTKDWTQGTYVGRGFQPPYLMEVKMGSQVYTSPGPFAGSPGAAIYWTRSLEWISTAFLTPQPLYQGSLISDKEIDMAEFKTPDGTFASQTHLFDTAARVQATQSFNTVVIGNSQDGVSIWSRYIDYDVGQGAGATSAVDPFDNQRYLNQVGANYNNPAPHLNPGQWILDNFGGANRDPGGFDASALNVYSTLVLPTFNSSPLGPNSSDWVGSVYCFFNGGCVALGVFDPLSRIIPDCAFCTTHTGQYYRRTDGHHAVFIIGADPNVPLYVDFARVMQ